jgi:hypothetical protein
MTQRSWLAALVLAGLGALGACHKNATDGAGGSAPPGAPAAQHVDGTPHPDTVVKAWQGAGLPAEGFAPLAPVPYGAAYCEEGRVDTIDTVLCEYHDAESLARGKGALLDQWGREGGHTGLAFQTKLTLLGVFDRARRDPNGKTISKVIDTFRKL